MASRPVAARAMKPRVRISRSPRYLAVTQTLMDLRMRLYAPGLAVVVTAACAPTPTVSPTPVTTASAPALYTPRNIEQAFRNGTRSPAGRPGPKYWQNRARYDIAITALPPDRNLRGTEEIIYSNH